MVADDDRGAGSAAGSDGRTETETDTPAATDPTGPTCPHCDAPMFKRHCKYVCPNHGVIIDCSDPFL